MRRAAMRALDRHHLGLDQLVGDVDAFRRIALVVEHHDLDLAAEQAARCVDLLEREIDAPHLPLRRRGQRPGLGRRHADHDRLRCAPAVPTRAVPMLITRRQPPPSRISPSSCPSAHAPRSTSQQHCRWHAKHARHVQGGAADQRLDAGERQPGIEIFRKGDAQRRHDDPAAAVADRRADREHAGDVLFVDRGEALAAHPAATARAAPPDR